MEKIIEKGIQLRNWNVGDHKTTCPQCSHTRRNKKDQCLSVTIEADDGVVWKCHHCEWSGAVAGTKFSAKPYNNHLAILAKPKEYKRPLDRDWETSALVVTSLNRLTPAHQAQ